MGASDRPSLWFYLWGEDEESQRILAAAYYRLSELATVVFGVALTLSIGDPTKISGILIRTYRHHDELVFWSEILIRLVSPFIAWLLYVRTLIVSKPWASWSIFLMGAALLVVIPMEICAFALPMRVTFSDSVSGGPLTNSQDNLLSQLFYSNNAGSLEALFGIFFILICASNILGTVPRRVRGSVGDNQLTSRTQAMYLAAFTGMLRMAMLVFAVNNFMPIVSSVLGYLILGLTVIVTSALRLVVFRRQAARVNVLPTDLAASRRVANVIPRTSAVAETAGIGTQSNGATGMLGSLMLIALVICIFRRSRKDRA